jgi:hypothetical protein
MTAWRTHRARRDSRDPEHSTLICRTVAFAIALVLSAFANPPVALAWGAAGHRTVALVADAILEDTAPTVRAQVTAMLAADETNTLTAHDIAGQSVWADVLRDTDPAARTGTGTWHFVNLELDGPDLTAACRVRVPASAGTSTSGGPADDCIVSRITAFSQDRSNGTTPPEERLLALKFLLHLVADLHQPLHAADNHDRGGNCVGVVPPGASTPVRLHTYWDVNLVRKALPHDPGQAAQQLLEGLDQDAMSDFRQGEPADWAQESFELAQSVAYNLPTGPNPGGYVFPPRFQDRADPCGAVEAHALDREYDARATAVVREQLLKAGIRLAALLRRSLEER